MPIPASTRLIARRWLPCAFVALAVTIPGTAGGEGGSGAGNASMALRAAPDPEVEFNRRREAIGENVTAQLELAAWASENGLSEKAAAMYRKIAEADPTQFEAYRRLCDLAAMMTLPNQSKARSDAEGNLDHTFKRFESKRFILFSDAGPDLARARLELLERTHHQVMRWAERLDLRPLPLQNKQVSILFAHHADYAVFASMQDNLMNTGISGYYSPAHDWVVFDDALAIPEVAKANEGLHSIQQQVDALTEEVRKASNAGGDEAGALRRRLDAAKQSLRETSERFETLVRQEHIATAVHECTHQLLFHTRIQSPFVHAPIWICEGLATNFETDSPQNAFGPDVEYLPRRRRFETLRQQGRLLDVRELVRINELPTDEPDRIDVIYQQSYALVKWLCRHRKEALQSYMAALRTHPSGEITPDEQVALFERCFGDAAALEKAWLRYEATQAQTTTAAASLAKSD